MKTIVEGYREPLQLLKLLEEKEQKLCSFGQRKFDVRRHRVYRFSSREFKNLAYGKRDETSIYQ